MQREYPQQPLIGVGAIIISEGKVALIKRGKPPLLGEWSVPGGMLELGETLRAGAEREAREETGLTVKAKETLGVFERLVPDESGRMKYHYVLIDFLCEVVSGELRAGHDASEARWFTREEAGALPLPEDTAGVVNLGFTKSL